MDTKRLSWRIDLLNYPYWRSLWELIVEHYKQRTDILILRDLRIASTLILSAFIAYAPVFILWALTSLFLASCYGDTLQNVVKGYLRINIIFSWHREIKFLRKQVFQFLSQAFVLMYTVMRNYTQNEQKLIEMQTRLTIFSLSIFHGVHSGCLIVFVFVKGLD